MKTAQKIAESGKQEIAITYDLAVAKMALQIQAEEFPRFNNVFISLRSFHIDGIFPRNWKIYCRKWRTNFTECGVIATGSLSGLLSGKHYNRCKRIHPLLAVAIELMHFRSFLRTDDNSNSSMTLIGNNLLDIQCKSSNEAVILKELRDL